MKTKEQLERCRVKPSPTAMAATAAIVGYEGSKGLLTPQYIEDEHGVYSTGMFHYKGKHIIITIDDGLWHLSASANHTLGYYELKELRYEFMPDDMTVAQIFPRRESFVNIHENCFHLWQLRPGAYSKEPEVRQSKQNETMAYQTCRTMTDKKSDLGNLLIQFPKANGLEWTKDDTGVACLMNDGQTLTIFNKPTIMASRPQRGIIYGTIYYPDRKLYPIRYVDDITIGFLRKKITESLLGHTAGQLGGGRRGQQALKDGYQEE